MKKGTIITLAIVGLFMIVGFSLFNSYRSVYDRNVQLKNKFKKQESVIASYYDKMWKVLKQQASLTDQAAETFKDIYIPLISGRYEKGDGTLMKWIQEQNPNFDQSLYTKLMDNIDILRTDFTNQETIAATIKEEHDNLRQEFWSSIWLKGEPELIWKSITSSKTENAVKTRIDDDIELFNSGKK